jgi:hypothetical protein
MFGDMISVGHKALIKIYLIINRPLERVAYFILNS